MNVVIKLVMTWSFFYTGCYDSCNNADKLVLMSTLRYLISSKRYNFNHVVAKAMAT